MSKKFVICEHSDNEETEEKEEELLKVIDNNIYFYTSVTEESIMELTIKLKELTNAREIRLVITVDPDLIGGFLITTSSKVMDYTIKNQLQNLAKHLDSVLEL